MTLAAFTGRETFDPVPSVAVLGSLELSTVAEPPQGTTLGIFVSPGGDLPEDSPLDWKGLAAVGFEAKKGQTVPLPTKDGRLILAGLGEGDLDANGLRDAAAAISRATSQVAEIAIALPGILGAQLEGQLAVEGVTLARYRYDALKSQPTVTPLSTLTLVGDDAEAVAEGAERGRAMAEATTISRDLANTPPALLTATQMAEVAIRLGAERGLDIEVYDEDDLKSMACGGMLGVNAGSTEPPRMIKMVFEPEGGADATLSLVGKGIMYDAGGLALKPADPVHAAMKNDMSGAGAILGTMVNLGRLGCPNKVVAFLCCTDNRPSGSAIAMGDVLTVRGGTTVEVANTDAEGRLVMADGLVLATEEPTDAIVDIATLTGAAMRTMGTEIAV
ncbi:MAG TPA: leucyl aminopeptidase family protein, partial [Acidimicrobiia bacterium]|nr:leucyl aminopeptidase family protein [Acidimicrobiia bacterium]